MKNVILLFLSLTMLHVSAYPTFSVPSPLYTAAKNGDLQNVKELIKNGANIDEHNPSSPEFMWGEEWYNENVNLTPIYGAIDSKNIDVVNFLIQSGANLNAPGNGYHDSSVLMAAADQFPQVFEKLIQHGAINGYEDGLYYLVKNNDIALLKEALVHRKTLLDDKVNKNILSNLLITAIKALKPIDLKLFSLLIDLGADVNYIKNVDNLKKSTTLHFIAEYRSNVREGKWTSDSAVKLIIKNKIEMIEILVKNGADHKAKDLDGKRPFELAPDVQIAQALNYGA